MQKESNLIYLYVNENEKVTCIIIQNKLNSTFHNPFSNLNNLSNAKFYHSGQLVGFQNLYWRRGFFSTSLQSSLWGHLNTLSFTLEGCKNLTVTKSPSSAIIWPGYQQSLYATAAYEPTLILIFSKRNWVLSVVLLRQVFCLLKCGSDEFPPFSDLRCFCFIIYFFNDSIS